MYFKDFIRDRMKYIAIYFANTCLVILVMYLTLIIKGWEFPGKNALYAGLMSLVLFVCFIAYDYMRLKPFYKHLNAMLESKDNIEYILNIQNAEAIENKTYKQILLNFYKAHGNKIAKYEESQKQYKYFTNQWVHQMKTPVSVINLLLQDYKDESNREVFESIREENEKLSQGLEMMLYNARLNDFNLDFQVDTVDIVPIVRKVIGEHKKSLIKYSIFPKLSGESETFVETDSKWISFVINQILVNAIKYSKDIQREKKSVAFDIKAQETKVILSIEDQGIGIPKEDLSRVFRAFFTGKNGRVTSESTGMGMYLSKRICDELGHDLYVEAEEGKGAKFSIVFYKGKNIFKL